LAARTTSAKRSGKRHGASNRPPLAAATSAETPSPSAARRGYHAWLVLAGLAVLLLAQLWTSVRLQSVTRDEMDHLHAGYRYLQCGDFGWNPEHPPLAKMVDALPLLLQPIQDPVVGACGSRNDRGVDLRTGHDFLFANPESVLFSARVAASLFAVALLCVVWLAATKMFGLPTAIVAGVLLAFEPTILGHGALVTTDVPAALGFSASVFAFHAYLVHPTRARCLLVGLATGVAFALKYSAVLLVPILIVLAIADALLVRQPGSSLALRIRRHAFALAGIFLVALAVLWTAYGWRYDGRPGDARVWTNSRLQEVSGTVATKLIPALETRQVLPEAYLHGLQDVLVESEIGRPSFILGHLYRSGRWFYLPTAAVIKFSLVVLLLAAIAWGALRFWRQRQRELLVLALPALMYLAAGTTSGLNMGIRYLLPAVPFLIVFAAAGAWALASNSRELQVVLSIALAWHVASSLRAFPNYISYSNELWGGPAATYKQLSESDVDWGQALKQAKAYLDRTRPKSCWMFHPYFVANNDYGIACGESSQAVHQVPPLHYTGTIIASSGVVTGLDRPLGGAPLTTIFRGRQPIATLGGSALLVYEGDFDLTVVAAYQHLALAQQELGANRQQAMADAEAAAALAPDSPAIHALTCSLARLRGEFERAERECNLALQLFRTDPTASLTDAAGLAKFMRRNGMKIYAHRF
jgi:4-amino-4-deoxy-L-arabinose transferase-like glycosyltransferase